MDLRKVYLRVTFNLSVKRGIQICNMFKIGTSGHRRNLMNEYGRGATYYNTPGYNNNFSNKYNQQQFSVNQMTDYKYRDTDFPPLHHPPVQESKQITELSAAVKHIKSCVDFLMNQNNPNFPQQ